MHADPHPGTGKETARLALAAASALKTLCNANAPRSRLPGELDAILDAKRYLKLAERRELVAAGKLPGSSPLPFPVALGVDMVAVIPPNREYVARLNQEAFRSHASASLAMSVELALEGTLTGMRELWFDAGGNAFLSFELEEDATLFRLALDA